MTTVRLLLTAALACLLLLPAAAAGAATPRAFFGVMGDGPLLDGRADVERETRLMKASGVGSLRIAFYWRAMQPEAAGPVDFRETDAAVGAAARSGLRVMPVLLRAPTWATGGDDHPGAVPRETRSYADFTAAVVARYGNTGSFWVENPGVPRTPVRLWQVWNEPDIRLYWNTDRWAETYVPFLRAAHEAIKAVDPAAQVVGAGLTNRSWEDLDELYEAGAGPYMDVAAIHPFSLRVENVAKIVRLARQTMRRRGDATKPLMLSEVSWSSGKGRSRRNYGWEMTEKGQAAKIREALPVLARMRVKYRLAGLYWYTWLSPPIGSGDSFDYSGLRRLNYKSRALAKPALAAWRTTVTRLQR